VLFQADGVPLGPFDPAWQDLERWALRLSMPRLQVGSSGHATPGDLTRIAHESGVPVVMCVHSYHPELLRTGNARLLLPQRGRRYVLDQIDVDQPAAP
jgi:ribonuclease J